MSRRDEALAAFETAIEQLAKQHLDSDDIVTDAVVALGAQYIDDDGDRIGRVFVFPRHGSQPAYITRGLLSEAVDMLRRAES